MDGVNKVKEVKLQLNNEIAYHVGDILKNFQDYFGMSLNELQNFLCNYKIIKKETIIDYIINHQDDMWESKMRVQAIARQKIEIIDMEKVTIEPINIEEIIAERVLDYEMFRQKIAILAHKGMTYLSLLIYVANEKNIFQEDDFHELIFNYLNISHYGKGMTGKHLKQLLTPLSYIVKEINTTLTKINNLETYRMQIFDSLACHYGENKLYTTDKLIYTDDSYYIDKTTFYHKKVKIPNQKII